MPLQHRLRQWLRTKRPSKWQRKETDTHTLWLCVCVWMCFFLQTRQWLRAKRPLSGREATLTHTHTLTIYVCLTANYNGGCTRSVPDNGREEILVHTLWPSVWMRKCRQHALATQTKTEAAHKASLTMAEKKSWYTLPDRLCECVNAVNMPLQHRPRQRLHTKRPKSDKEGTLTHTHTHTDTLWPSMRVYCRQRRWLHTKRPSKWLRRKPWLSSRKWGLSLWRKSSASSTGLSASIGSFQGTCVCIGVCIGVCAYVCVRVCSCVWVCMRACPCVICDVL